MIYFLPKLQKFKLLIFSLLGFLIFGVSLYNTFASFTPGQTLDPNCAPLDPGCYVDVSFSETDAIVGAVNGIVKSDGSANFSAATAGVDYEVPLTFSTGLTRSLNTITVNSTQSIVKLSNLTSNGFVKTSAGDGTLIIDTNTYLTSALVSLNGLSGSSQTFSIGSAGSDFNISSFGSIHTFNIPTASASARGLLSSSDWSAFNSKQGALTFSTGLTDASSTITVNLSTGISGGQSIVGGTGAGENLTLSSTTNGTKGNIIFGNSFYSEDLEVLSLNTTNTDFRLNIDVGAVNPDGGIMAVGSLGAGVDLNVSGFGTRMFWYPKKAAFRAGYVGTTEWDNANIGDNSVAFGDGNTASGVSSAAFNSGNTASGQQSVAFGGGNVSSGSNSAVFGLISNVSGNNSASFGRINDVSGLTSFAFGERMTVSGNNSFGVNMDENIPQTISGNQVFSILGGSVGIGTASPVSALTVGSATVDGSIFAYGDIGLGAFPNGSGTQMMWYPRKAAFRAGYEGGIQWNDPDIGLASASFGSSGIASGAHSYSFGNQSNATGDTTFSFGSMNDASGDYSVVFGSNTTVSGDYSFGINLNSTTQTISANNVMAIMGGKVGIGSVAPEFALTLGDINDVNTDGGIMAIGTYGAGASLSTSGAGTRMFWYPRKSAFRAGVAALSYEFDDQNIGDYSFAFGNGPIANSSNSIALGNQAFATANTAMAFGDSARGVGESSVAIGTAAHAFGSFSVVLGGFNASYASGLSSFAFGAGSKTGYEPDGFYVNNPGDRTLFVNGDATARFVNGHDVNIYVDQPAVAPSTKRQVTNVFFNGVDTEITIDSAIDGVSIGGRLSSENFGVAAFSGGSNTSAIGDYSIALGSGSQATGYASVALGDQAFASGNSAVALSGMSQATGDYSFSVGSGAIASGLSAIALGDGNMAFGRYSLALGQKMEVSGDNSVGINLDGSSQMLTQSNTLAIMGGNVGIGMLNPSISLHVIGDAEVSSGFTIGGMLSVPSTPAYDDDTAAGGGGLIAGQVYQTTGAGAPPLDVPGILMIKQ